MRRKVCTRLDDLTENHLRALSSEWAVSSVTSFLLAQISWPQASEEREGYSICLDVWPLEMHRLLCHSGDTQSLINGEGSSTGGSSPFTSFLDCANEPGVDFTC